MIYFCKKVQKMQLKIFFFDRNPKQFNYFASGRYIKMKGGFVIKDAKSLKQP